MVDRLELQVNEAEEYVRGSMITIQKVKSGTTDQSILTLHNRWQE